MKRVVLASVILLMSFSGQASESSSSSSSAAKALPKPKGKVCPPQDPVQWANTLSDDENVISAEIRRCITALVKAKNKVDKKDVGKINEINQFLTILRLKWAEQVLRLSLNDDDEDDSALPIPDVEEIRECIENLNIVIGSDMQPIQRAWAYKKSRESKSNIVAISLPERETLIDEIKDEEGYWQERFDQVTQEVEKSPDDLPGNPLELQDYVPQKDDQKPIPDQLNGPSCNQEALTTVQEHLNTILDLLNRCKDITQGAVTKSGRKELDADDDNDELDGSLEPADALKKSYQQVINTVVRQVLSPFQTTQKAKTLDEIQKEYVSLISESRDRAGIALRAVSDYRTTQERLKINREKYSQNRMIESDSFTDEHHRLVCVDTTNKFLKVRLKLLIPDMYHFTEEETTLLEQNKEELTPKEKVAFKKLSSGCIIQ